MKKQISKAGFTIVELLVVITVIATLATITFFIMSGWRTETAKTEVKNDLQNVVSEIDAYRTFRNEYPNSFADLNYKPTKGVVIEYHLRSDGESYCINGSSSVESVEYMVDTRSGKHLADGTCTAA